MSEVKITSDQIVEVSTMQQTPLYVSKYSDNNFRHLTLRPYGGDSASIGSNGIKTDLSGYNVQFNIPTNTFAISPFSSYYKYTGQFTFKFFQPGRYCLRNKRWFFEAATFNATTVSYDYSTKPKCVAVGARNAFCVMDNTEVTYSTKTNTDQNIFQQRTFYQNQLGPEIQDKQNSTWFDGQNDAWVVEFLPFTVDGTGQRTYVDWTQDMLISADDYFEQKNGAALTASQTLKEVSTNMNSDKDNVSKFYYTTDGTKIKKETYVEFTTQKDFVIPWNLLNMVFDHEHLEYFNSISGQDVILKLDFVNTYFAYLFAKTDQIFEKTKTGIIRNELHLMIKDDSNFKSDVQAMNQIIHKIVPYDVWSVATRQSLTGHVDEPINRTMKSMNDFYLMFTPYEQGVGNCTQYRQDSTFFTCDQIVKMANGIYDNRIECFAPMNFNLKRNGGSDRIFTEDVNCLETFRQEVLRCYNYTGNNYLGTNSSLSRLDKMMQQDFFVAVNLQQWALDLGVNPVGDGIDNSGSARLMMSYDIGYYTDNMIGNSPTKYSGPYSAKNTITNYDVNCYINYDAFSIFNLSKMKWTVEENLSKYVQ